MSKELIAFRKEPYQQHTRNSKKAASEVQLPIAGFEVVALTDMGADYSVMSGPFPSKLKKVMTRWDGPHIRIAGGHLVTPRETCTYCVTIDGA